MRIFRMRNVASVVLLGLTVLITGCVSGPEATFATRNATADVDLRSIVRTQSNDLLAMTMDLESHTKSNFRASKKLDRDLEETVVHMDQLHMNLPALLAKQDVELAELRDMVSKGTMQKTQMQARTVAIQTYRKSLVASLNASATRVNIAANGLKNALSEGRTDLGYQTRTAHELARDLRAARTMIEMQL